MKDFTLMIHEGETKQEVALTRDYYVLGRDKSCDIRFVSATVSRYHAYLSRLYSPSRQPYYRIVDGSPTGQRSSNGLIVDNQRIKNYDLQHGDRVMLGPDVYIEYFAHGEISKDGEDTVA